MIFPFFHAFFPFFYAFFPFFYAFFPFFYAFLCFSLKGQGQTTAIYCKIGEFHSDPVCTDPVQNFPMSAGFTEIAEATENDENRGNLECKPWVPQTMGLEIPSVDSLQNP